MSFTEAVRRVQREHPAWSYSQCCAECQRRSVAVRNAKRARKEEPAGTYWWNKSDSEEENSLTSEEKQPNHMPYEP